MFKRLKQNWPVPDYAHFSLILTALSMAFSFYFSRVFGIEPRYTPALPLDNQIQVVPAFTYIYVLAYFYWIASYIWISRFSKAFAYRLSAADTMGKLVSFFCFLFLPCTIQQPALSELSGAGAWLLKIIYFFDTPTNLLPSLHCYVSYLCFRPLFEKDAPKVHWALKYGSVIFALLVCLSTLFTRQHLIVDGITGLLLGEITWQLAGPIANRFLKK